MSHEEIYWLKACSADQEKYRIDVDNDCIFVTDTEEDRAVFTFDSFGWEFIVLLLNHIGCNAEAAWDGRRPRMDNVTIGQRLAQCIREDAKKKGLSMKQAREAMGIHYNTLRQWEHNIQVPHAYALQYAAQQGWDVNWILTGTPSSLVKRGRWGEYERYELTPSSNGFPCSECGQHQQRKTPHCPNCGAKNGYGGLI